ncbi:MAG: type II secretion system protein [Desulfobacterales bacterium]|jgi:MSHA pilin protein MshC
MKRDQYGFTLIEITAVLVLMAIISAYVIGRAIGTEQIDLAGQTDKIRAHIRYAQARAMKRSDAEEIWGIKFDSATDEYWLFFATIPVDPGEPDLADQQVTFPGEQNNKVSAADVGVDIQDPAFNLLFFDRFGIPFTRYVDDTDNDALNAPLNITLLGSDQSRTVQVIPETGLVQ